MPGPVVPNQALLNGINPLAYMGVRPSSPALYLIETRDPSTIDKNYALGTWWMNNQSPYKLWRLANLNAGVATWITVSSAPGDLVTLTSNTGGPVPSLAGNINVVGDGVTITGVGNSATNTITFSLIGGGAAIESITGNSGGAVTPLAGNINIVGDPANNITISDNPGTHTLTAAVTGTTNHLVQVGNSTGSLHSVPNGTTGQILTAQTGADPIWTTVGAGSSVGFFAYQTVDLTNVTGDGTKYVVVFDAVKFDSATSYNNATGVYTIPVTGNWCIGAQFQYVAGGGGGNQSTIILNVPITGMFTEINGNTFPTKNQLANFDGANAAITHQVNAYTPLTAGDVISIVAEGAGGTKSDSLIGPASFVPSGLTGTFYAFLDNVGTGGALTTLHAQDGNNVSPTAGIINVSGGSNLTTTGTAGPNTLTVSLSGITQHDVQVGGAGNSLTQIANGTAGQYLTAQTAADPIWTTPTQPNFSPVAFSAYIAVQVPNFYGDGNYYIVPCDTELFDVGNNYNLATNVFTAPVTGKYLFTAVVGMINLGATGTVSFWGVQLVVTPSGSIGSFVQGDGWIQADDVSAHSETGTWILELSAGDTVELQAMSLFQSGAARTVTASGAGRNVFSGVLLTGLGEAVHILHTQDGNDVTPAVGIINVSGSGGLTTTGTAGPNTVTVTLSTIPAFGAYVSADIPNVTGNGTAFVVPFDTEIFDNLNNYNNATGVFTAPQTGRYHFSTMVQNDNISTQTNATIRFNVVGTSANVYGGSGGNPANVGNGGFYSQTLSLTIFMTAGDTCTVASGIGGGPGTLTVGVNGAAAPASPIISYFSGYLVH